MLSLNGATPYMVWFGTYLASVWGVYRFAVHDMNGKMVIWDNRLKDKVDRRELESVEHRMDDGFKGVNQRLTDMSKHVDLMVSLLKKNGNHNQ